MKINFIFIGPWYGVNFEDIQETSEYDTLSNKLFVETVAKCSFSLTLVGHNHLFWSAAQILSMNNAVFITKQCVPFYGVESHEQKSRESMFNQEKHCLLYLRE